MFRPDIAHVILENGMVFQVLNEDETDWDEVATKQAVDEYLIDN